MRPHPTDLLLLLSLAAGMAAAPSADAQQQAAAKEPGGAAAPVVYRREVFRYQRAGRPDPFRSLLSPEDLGYRIEDMQLAGIIYSPDARNSVAVLSETVSKKRFRLKVGERLGGITVAAIHPRRVDVVINEFGVVRRESLHLRRPPPAVREEGQDQGAPPPPPPQPAPRGGTEAQKGSGR
jgi:hypothetical protein